MKRKILLAILAILTITLFSNLASADTYYFVDQQPSTFTNNAPCSPLYDCRQQGQTFTTGSGVTEITNITLEMASSGAYNCVNVTIWDSPSRSSLLGQKNITIAPSYLTFSLDFDPPISVSSSTQYYIHTIAGNNDATCSNQGAPIFYWNFSSTTNPYSGGQFYTDDIGSPGTMQAKTNVDGLFITYYSLDLNSSLNISIYDETTNTLITADASATFVGPTYAIFNTSTGNITLNNFDEGSYTVTITADGYNSKEYTIDLGAEVFQEINAYLSNSTDTTIFTITDKDTGATIQGATIYQYRQIAGNYTLVDTLTSDITGRAEITYTEGVNYEFLIANTGYNSENFYLTPVLFDSYSIKLQSTTSLNDGNTPDNLGVIVRITTGNNTIAFYNDANNTLNWTIYAPAGILDSYNLNIYYPDGQNASFSGFNGSGETFSNRTQLTGQNSSSEVIVYYCYDTSIGGNKCFQYIYNVIAPASNYSWINAGANAGTDLSLFDKILISTVLVVGVTGLLYALGGYFLGLPAGLLVYGMLVKIGFIPLWAIIPTLVIGLIVLMGSAKRG